jgi:hypothetical protein
MKNAKPLLNYRAFRFKIIGMDSKICSKCKTDTILSAYVKNKMGYLGFKSICKKCTNKNIPKKTEQEKKDRKKEMFRKWCLINRPRKTKDSLTRTCSCCKKTYPKTVEYFRVRGEKLSHLLRTECRVCFDEKQRIRHKEFYKNNTEKEKERHKFFYYRDIEYTHKKNHQTYLKNIDRVKKYDKERREVLADCLILNSISATTGISRYEVPKEMIETKRLIIKLKRELKPIK